MVCEEIRDDAGELVAIACGPSRRVCDVCDKKASGPRDRLKDGTEFDVCRTCRARIEAIRGRGRRSLLSNDDVAWVVYAHDRIRHTLERVS